MSNEIEKTSRATFAGGCFWCMEPPFEQLEGVIEVVSGYTGGGRAEATYEQVCSGTTGHLEAVQVTYDPSRVSYDRLLEVFWRQIDPTDPGGQFADRGQQYATAVFYHDQEQKRLAEASRDALALSGGFDKAIATAVRPFQGFYPAEEYHQDYYKKSPAHYKAYRAGSGRQSFLDEKWRPLGNGERSATSRPALREDELKKKLSPLQYRVIRENGTEPPFDNAFWNNKQEGIYVDAVSGEPLFSSTDKFDSGTGWPSFTRPLDPGSVVKRKDGSLGMARVEVRSRKGDSHLGHVFDDGPGPDGLRYCINSAALSFIPRERLQEAGYGEYLKLFEETSSSAAGR